MADGSDPIRTYLDSITGLENATAVVNRLVSQLRHIAAELEHWQHVGIANVSVGLPVGAVDYSLNAEQWPQPVALAEALSAWHQARAAVRNAWARLPDTDRRGLQPPPV